MSSLSFTPPGLSGVRRGCGSGDACCDGAAEDSGGVGNPALVADAMLELLCDLMCRWCSEAERVCVWRRARDVKVGRIQTAVW
jgi:hypothetical protein